MIRGLAVVALLGCSAPAKPPPIRNEVHAPDAPYCPSIATLGPWQSELFPACPAWPIMVARHVCAGTCPMPCASTSESFERVGTGPRRVTYSYDELGKLFWSESDQESMREHDIRCSYIRGVLTTCSVSGDAVIAHREGSIIGRLVGVTTGTEVAQIRYDARGRVVAVGDQDLRYDVHGRLVAHGDTTLERDARGHVIAARGPKWIDLFTYDARDRVVRVERRPTTPDVIAEPGPPCEPDADGNVTMGCDEPGGPVEQHSEWSTFTYDGDRLIAIAHHAVPEAGGSTAFEYDCE